MIDIEATFEKFNDEVLKFENVENKIHSRPDLCAFILLDKLVPGNMGMVSYAKRDEIYLEVRVEDLAKVATEEDIVTLIRCGVRYDSSYDCFCMFV